MVKNKAENERNLKSVVQNYSRICWCPTSNNYPALFYLSGLFSPYSGIEDKELPDLFIISDVRPPVQWGFYTPRSLGSEDWMNSSHIYPEPNVDGETEYDGLLFSVDVLAVERLEDLNLPIVLSYGMDSMRQIAEDTRRVTGETWRDESLVGLANTDGRCFYMHVSVSSGDKCYETDLVYVFADPLSFAVDFLLEESVPLEYVAYGVYGQGWDGLDKGTWLAEMIPLLKPAHLLADSTLLVSDVLDWNRCIREEEDSLQAALALWSYEPKLTKWKHKLSIAFGDFDESGPKNCVPWNDRSSIYSLGFYDVDADTLPHAVRVSAEAHVEQVNGMIRIRFSEKPEVEIRMAMKNRHFRYDPNEHCWYAPAEHENLLFAEQLTQA
ncbi:MAG: hypothetical protein K6A72_09085 [Lachnospiraceae bacterium]|nr:hypothetical protein [Lachnospiraceae bacterium]